MRMIKFASLVGAAVMASCIGTGTWADTKTGSLIVTSSVAQACIVTSTATLGFGAYDPIVANAASALAGTGSVSLTCTKGSSGINIDLDAGVNALSSQRRMVRAGGGDFLNYNILQPAITSPWTSCTGTTWGSTVGGGSVYTPGGVMWSSSAAQAFTVCGSVPAAQNPSAGSYSDTVTVTVNF
jgi:spore coat protein U-like protein